MRVSAAGNMPLQGLVKPPAKPVVMICLFCTKHRLWRFFHATNVQPCGKGQRQGPLLGGGFGGFLEPGAKRSEVQCFLSYVCLHYKEVKIALDKRIGHDA